MCVEREFSYHLCMRCRKIVSRSQKEISEDTEIGIHLRLNFSLAKNQRIDMGIQEKLLLIELTYKEIYQL